MRLSVVIPTFNTASMTLDCVHAVRASMPAETEIIVVDDGSTDDTSQLLPTLRLDVNRGFAAAANHGVNAATGDIILLLNSDALVQPGALQAFLDAFERDETLGVAGAQLLNEDGTKQWSGGRTPTLAWMIGAVSGLGKHGKALRGTPRIDWVSGAAMAFRREVWEPLNEHYHFYCQDIDFCLRASERGWKVRVIDEARVVHGLGKTIGGVDRKKLKDDLLTWGRSRYGRAWWLAARIILGVMCRTSSQLVRTS